MRRSAPSVGWRTLPMPSCGAALCLARADRLARFLPTGPSCAHSAAPEPSCASAQALSSGRPTAEGGARHGGGADDSARRAAQHGLRDARDHRRTPSDLCNQRSKQTSGAPAAERGALPRPWVRDTRPYHTRPWAWATARQHAPCCRPHAHAPCNTALRRLPGSRHGAHRTQASLGRAYVFTQTCMRTAARAGARPDLLVRVRRRCGVQRRAGRLQNRT